MSTQSTERARGFLRCTGFLSGWYVGPYRTPVRKEEAVIYSARAAREFVTQYRGNGFTFAFERCGAGESVT